MYTEIRQGNGLPVDHNASQMDTSNWFHYGFQFRFPKWEILFTHAVRLFSN